MLTELTKTVATLTKTLLYTLKLGQTGGTELRRIFPSTFFKKVISMNRGEDECTFQLFFSNNVFFCSNIVEFLFVCVSGYLFVFTTYSTL